MPFLPGPSSISLFGKIVLRNISNNVCGNLYISKLLRKLRHTLLLLITFIQHYSLLSSGLTVLACDSTWVASFSIVSFWISTEVMCLQHWHGWCLTKLLPCLCVLRTPGNHALCHFMQSHIIIIMYIYHALISALSAHMIHINLNMVFYTHVQHSSTKTIYIKYII